MWKKLEFLSSGFLEEIFGFSMYSKAKLLICYFGILCVLCCPLNVVVLKINLTLLRDVKKQTCAMF